MDPVSPAARVVRSQFNALYARLLSRNDDGSGSNSPSHNPRSTLDIFPASTAQPNPDRSSALETYPALASQPAADDRSAFENSCSSRLLAHPSPSPLPTSNSSLPPVPASTHTSALVPVRAQAPVHSLQAQDAALLPGPPRRRPRRRPTFAPIVRKRPRKAPSASSCDDTGHEARRTRTAGAGASGPSIPREEVCAVCRGVARVGGSVRSRRTTPRPCNGVKDCSARLDGACHVKGGGVRGEEAAEVERGGESEGAGGAGGGCAQLAPCNHVYHTKCIVPWLELRNTCPLCRGVVTTMWRDDNPRAVTIPERKQKLHQDDAVDYIYETLVCTHCHDGCDEELMLICDGCDRGFHTYCAGIDHIPQADWFCSRCRCEDWCGDQNVHPPLFY